MSDARPTDSPSGGTATDRSLDATREAIAAFEKASDLGPIERVKAEQEAALEFADAQASALSDGLQPAHMRSACDTLSGEAKNYTKSDLINLVEDRLEELVEKQDTRRPFDTILREDLEEVVIVRTTDARQKTIYRWQFREGAVETRSTKDGRTHFRWTGFRDEYYDATGEDPKKPTKEVRGGEEWREMLVRLIEERGREVTTRGPRTTAVDSLKNFIRRTRSFASVEDMVDYDGLYIDGDPSEGEASEIWVRNHDIKRICDENELNSVIELQNELDARGYSVPRIAGVSESTFVHGSKETYWVLDASIADPATYEPEPDSPAEQLRREREEAEGEEGGDEGEEMGAGEIGAVGTDPDGGDSE